MVETKESGPGIIKAMTVPQLMEKYQVPGFEFLKMDIEGEPIYSYIIIVLWFVYCKLDCDFDSSTNVGNCFVFRCTMFCALLCVTSPRSSGHRSCTMHGEQSTF